MYRGTTTQLRTFVYDSNGRLYTETHPESGTKTNTYNADGTLATRTDAKNQQVKYVYDPNYPRVLQIKRYPVANGSEDTCQRMTFTYGTVLDSTNTWGRRKTATWGGTSCAITANQTFTYTYTYTPSGLIKTKKLNTKTVTYTYDNEGRQVSVLNPLNGMTYTYAFDAMGRPTQLTDNQSTPFTWVSSAVYGPADEMQQITVFSGDLYNVTETFTYNSQLQVTNINTGAGGMGWTYAFSPTQNNGQITQAQNSSGETLTYTYDSLKRVLQASDSWPAGGSWSQGYAYDGFGNLTDKNVLSGSAQPLHVTVNPVNNQITGYTYDANGNLTAIPSSMTATYDIENRMVTATDSNGTSNYVYGPDNERVWYTPQSGTSVYYGAKGEKLGEVPAGVGISPITYINFAGRTIAKIAATTGNGYSVFQDRLGSQATVGGPPHWAPYGEHYASGTFATEGFATYFEGETGGLDYARNRYYSPTLARFTTPDPYRNSAGPGDPGSWNRYAYTRGDPVNRNDPSGLWDCAPWDSGISDCGDPNGGVMGGGGDPCFGVEGFEPGPYCPVPYVPPPQQSQSAPPLPSCSIELFTRPTPRQLGGFAPARHTYLEIIDPTLGIDDTLEGGPRDGGKLTGFIGKFNFTNGIISYPGSIRGTSPSSSSNVEVWDYTGPNACSDVLSLLGQVESYNTHVNRPTYYALGSYNSNSFTYTLLTNVGLDNSKPPGWIPGWKQRVPGLVPLVP